MGRPPDVDGGRAAPRGLLLPALLLVGAALVVLGLRAAGWSAAPGIAAFATVFLSIVIQATPFLVLGVLLSAAIVAFVPADLAERALPRNRALAVPVAVAVRVPVTVPVCVTVGVLAAVALAVRVRLADAVRDDVRVSLDDAVSAAVREASATPQLKGLRDQFGIPNLPMTDPAELRKTWAEDSAEWIALATDLGITLD